MYGPERRVDALSPDDKKRKLSHAERKDNLAAEIRLLESGVAVLRTRSLPPHVALQKDPILRPAAAEYAALLYSMRTQQLQVAKMQSALSRCLTDQHYYPLYSLISLSKDWNERRATLMAMRDQKIRTALDFVMGLERPHETMKKQFSLNQFENDQGDLCCVRFDTTLFPGVKSLQQVFDALSFYKNNMEIIISEQLGHITLRDDYDVVDDKAFNTRILSTNDSGVTTEGNVISFRAMLGKTDEGYAGEPCAIMVADSVDEDKRYPYLSQERVRKDISTAVVLTAKQANTTGDKLGDLVVTMRRAAFYKLRRPEFPLSVCQFEELRDTMMEWSDVMLKTMQGILYPRV
ncbi:unnamed protein product [Phytophthora lilii]|uniref:Unnamed protein product n=1 Tax=Phytophthora lilii TaxID=2077276 RepID=A0A9W6WNA5_9STRA|nr:unnamed protein product [Phytophthora lilii]